MAPAQKKTLTFRRAPWTAEALDHLAAAENYDTTGGLESVAAYARMGIPLYEGVDEAGEVLGRYVMEVQTGIKVTLTQQFLYWLLQHVLQNATYYTAFFSVSCTKASYSFLSIHVVLPSIIQASS